MNEILRRLKEETEALELKMEKLNDFLDTEKFSNLSKMDRYLLAAQLGSMTTYFTILTARIDLLKGEI